VKRWEGATAAIQDWRAGLPFLPVAILFFALFGRVLFAPSGHAPGTQDADFYIYYFPMTQMAFSLWRESGFPLWNPYLYAGMPLLPSLEVGLLYPPNWLHLVLTTERAFCVLYVLHIVLAGAGMWLYARGRGRHPVAALVSVVAYAFAAPTILHFNMGLTSLVYSSAWLPLLFALIDRCLKDARFCNFAILAVALACQFLAGFPMFTLLLAVLIPAYVLCFGIRWTEWLSTGTAHITAAFIGTALLALGLVAPQLLATWDHLQHVHRTELGYAQATHLSFPAINLLTTVLPALFGDDQACPYWGENGVYDGNMFCGGLTLLLALLAILHFRRREVAYWAISAALITALALGKDSVLYDFSFLCLPGVNRFRGIGRLNIFVVLGLSILAGIGANDLISGPRRRRFIWLLGAIIGFAGTGLLLRFAENAAPHWWQDFFQWVRRPGRELFLQLSLEQSLVLQNRSYTLLRNELSFAATRIFAAAVLMLLSQLRWAPPRVVLPVVLAGLCWELYAFDTKYIAVVDTSQWSSMGRRVRDAIPTEPDPFRVATFSADPQVPANRFLYGRLESIGGHENFVSERYSAFLYKWYDVDPQWQTYLTLPDDGTFYNLLNVKYYVRPHEQPIPAGDERVQSDVFQWRGQWFDLYRNPQANPRAFLVHEALRTSDLFSSVELLAALKEKTAHRGSTVEGDPGIAMEAGSSEATKEEYVNYDTYRAGHQIVNVHCASAALLIFVENFDAGWQATVDGVPTKTLPANVFMTAVPLNAGDHRVMLTYRPPLFRTGCLLGLLSVAVIGTGLGASAWRTRIGPAA